MESYLLDNEAVLRVLAFLLVLAAMAAWERAAGFRNVAVLRGGTRRWKQLGCGCVSALHEER